MYEYYDYIFYDRIGMTSKGRTMVNSGNRVTTGADVETFARVQKGNYKDTIYVPAFEYWSQPMETREKEKNMSVSMWCDIDDSATNYPNQIGHPFPSRDKKRRNMSFTDFNDDGSPNVQRGDICGYHADRNPFFNPHAAKALEGQSKADQARAKGYDPEYVDWLEKKNGVVTDSDS